MISEIFHSIQGEGSCVGHPAVFLRMAGCNLRCKWCDTPYALQTDEGIKMELNVIVKKIESFHCRHLVITGGEPLLQQELLRELLSKLDNYFVEIETNGSIASTLDEFVDQYNCSPKLNGSGNQEYQLMIKPNDKTWYKFVIDCETDWNETLKYIGDNNLPQDRILMMPQGVNSTELIDNSKWLVAKCQEYSYAFCPRLHILLWGNERGK